MLIRGRMSFLGSDGAAGGKGMRQMYDKVTQKDIERMEEEIEHRKLVVRKEALEAVMEAGRRLGLDLHQELIRGGTDGARMAEKAGVALEAHELRILGLRWEMEHSGRNGRIARQFVRWYLGNQT